MNHNREQTKFSITNKKFSPNKIHDERFFDWFDKEFDITSVVQT